MEQIWDRVTNGIIISALAVLMVLGILAVIQLVQRKSIKKVDQPLLALIVPLLLVVATYFIFDHVFVLNVRPNGSGEPSFPSTHTLITATIFFCTAILLPRYIKSHFAYISLDILMLVLLILLSVGRVLANMHWVSDVVGALIFSAVFALIYYLITKRSKDAKRIH